MITWKAEFDFDEIANRLKTIHELEALFYRTDSSGAWMQLAEAKNSLGAYVYEHFQKDPNFTGVMDKMESQL